MVCLWTAWFIQMLGPFDHTQILPGNQTSKEKLAHS